MKRFGVMGLVFIGFVAGVFYVYSCGGGSKGDAQTNAELLARIEVLEAKLAYMSVADSTINGLAGPHVIFDGVNLHVQNGLGMTETINGLGNPDDLYAVIE